MARTLLDVQLARLLYPLLIELATQRSCVRTANSSTLPKRDTPMTSGFRISYRCGWDEFYG